MYPSTTIKIIDKSQYNRTVDADNSSAPIAMAGFACDRGTEDFGLWNNNDWHKMYGYTTNFKKYGQALKQAAMVIDNGGQLYCKRVVAPDAQLANLGVYVHVQCFPATAAVTNDDNEVTTPAKPARVVLKYNTVSVQTNQNDVERVASLIEGAIPASDPDNGDIVLPLFMVVGAGRGAWAPRFRVSPDYRFSRGSGYAKYLFEVIDPDDPNNEDIYFTAQPDKVEKGKNIFMQMAVGTNSKKVRVLTWEENFYDIYGIIETALGLEKDSLKDLDFLFGCDLKGNKLPNIEVDTSEFNLQNIYGNLLTNGSDGEFANDPLSTQSYVNELVKLFNGTYSEEIYNLDSISLDFIIDANYDDKVKRAIEEFVTFREDAFYMRDLGLEIEGIADIEEKERSVLHNRYSSTYINSMDVIDDDSKKYITVTISYLLVDKLINHFLNGRSRPFAGIRYGIFWLYGTDIKKGSINFLPKVTPGVDEKQQLDDLGVNFVSIYKGNRVVLETLYTSQHVNEASQLSYSCNVWSIQEVVKALREHCPISRYAIATGQDLEDYQADLKRVLSNYESNFLTFELEYLADPSYEAQKIYYACLSVTFPDFYQSEYFKIVALPNF